MNFKRMHLTNKENELATRIRYAYQYDKNNVKDFSYLSLEEMDTAYQKYLSKEEYKEHLERLETLKKMDRPYHIPMELLPKRKYVLPITDCHDNVSDEELLKFKLIERSYYNDINTCKRQLDMLEKGTSTDEISALRAKINQKNIQARYDYLLSIKEFCNIDNRYYFSVYYNNGIGLNDSQLNAFEEMVTMNFWFISDKYELYKTISNIIITISAIVAGLLVIGLFAMSPLILFAGGFMAPTVILITSFFTPFVVNSLFFDERHPKHYPSNNTWYKDFQKGLIGGSILSKTILK